MPGCFGPAKASIIVDKFINGKKVGLCPNCLKSVAQYQEDGENTPLAMEYEYAKNLAAYLWETYYKINVPEWEPCEDLMGVLTQIGNMITGLTVVSCKEQ